jgi:hypothetical protein
MHDQAASTHEQAGAFFDAHDKPQLAGHKRNLAEREAEQAEASREQAAKRQTANRTPPRARMP